MIDPAWIAALGVILFGVGLLGTFYHKNAIVVLMCIELMLNAANLNFVAAASHYGTPPQSWRGCYGGDSFVID